MTTLEFLLRFFFYYSIILLEMGNILSYSPDQIDDTQNTTQLRIVLDLNKPVHEELKQLLYWSL